MQKIEKKNELDFSSNKKKTNDTFSLRSVFKCLTI